MIKVFWTKEFQNGAEYEKQRINHIRSRYIIPPTASRDPKESLGHCVPAAGSCEPVLPGPRCSSRSGEEQPRGDEHCCPGGAGSTGAGAGGQEQAVAAAPTFGWESRYSELHSSFNVYPASSLQDNLNQKLVIFIRKPAHRGAAI